MCIYLYICMAGAVRMNCKQAQRLLVPYINGELDEKEEGELPEMLKDLTKEQVIWGTFLTFLIFW